MREHVRAHVHAVHGQHMTPGCTLAHMHACAQIHGQTYTLAYTWTHEHVFAKTQTHACTQVHTHTHTKSMFPRGSQDTRAPGLLSLCPRLLFPRNYGEQTWSLEELCELQG